MKSPAFLVLPVSLVAALLTVFSFTEGAASGRKPRQPRLALSYAPRLPDVSYDFGRGWSNGSLPGYSELAFGGRMSIEPPQQWLIMFHPKYGDTSQWKVRL